MIEEFYPTQFCKVISRNVSLGHLQVGNPIYKYEIPDYPNLESIRLVISLDKIINTSKFKIIYSSEETGYLEYDNNTYYRNCNVVNATNGHNLLYQGRLPSSRMELNWSETDGIIYVGINVSETYLLESRSRFTKNQSFDAFLNGLILHFSTYIGYLPFHAAAVTNELVNETVLFMGLPNTGKTSTSVGVEEKSHYTYLSEDIVFVNEKTLTVYPCPFTFNPKNANRYRSKRSHGNNLKTIVILQRTAGEASLCLLNNHYLEQYIVNMNFYEFAWLHNILIRSLFCTGNSSLSEVANKYLQLTKNVSQRVRGVCLTGEDPKPWADLLIQDMLRVNE